MKNSMQVWGDGIGNKERRRMCKKNIASVLDNYINEMVFNDKSKEECLCENEAMRTELEPLLETVSYINQVTKSIRFIEGKQ